MATGSLAWSHGDPAGIKEQDKGLIPQEKPVTLQIMLPHGLRVGSPSFPTLSMDGHRCAGHCAFFHTRVPFMRQEKGSSQSRTKRCPREWSCWQLHPKGSHGTWGRDYSILANRAERLNGNMNHCAWDRPAPSSTAAEATHSWASGKNNHVFFSRTVTFPLGRQPHFERLSYLTNFKSQCANLGFPWTRRVITLFEKGKTPFVAKVKLHLSRGD